MQQYNLFFNKWVNNKATKIYIGSLSCKPTLIQYELICGMMDNICGINLLLAKNHLYLFLKYGIQTHFECNANKILNNSNAINIKNNIETKANELFNLKKTYNKIIEESCIKFAKQYDVDAGIIIEIYNQLSPTKPAVFTIFGSAQKLYSDNFYKLSQNNFINDLNIQTTPNIDYNSLLQGHIKKYPAIDTTTFEVLLNDSFSIAIKKIINSYEISHDFMYNKIFKEIADKLHISDTALKHLYLSDSFESICTHDEFIHLHQYIPTLFHHKFIDRYDYEYDEKNNCYIVTIISNFSLFEYIEKFLIAKSNNI